MWSSKAKPGQGIEKLIVSHIIEPYRSERFAIVNKERGVGRYSKYFSMQESKANNAIKWFDTKCYAYIDTILRKKRYAIVILPNIDWNKAYTDEELYKYFDLTQQEINHIETTIKA